VLTIFSIGSLLERWEMEHQRAFRMIGGSEGVLIKDRFYRLLSLSSQKESNIKDIRKGNEVIGIGVFYGA